MSRWKWNRVLCYFDISVLLLFLFCVKKVLNCKGKCFCMVFNEDIGEGGDKDCDGVVGMLWLYYFMD